MGGQLVFSQHVIQRMAQRNISLHDIQSVLDHSEVIEDYPGAFPYPSRLLLGWITGRPLHVVAALNITTGETIIVTVYEPDPTLWRLDFRDRR